MQQVKQNIIKYLNDTDTDIRSLDFPRLKYKYTDTRYLFFGYFEKYHSISVNGIEIYIEDEELTR